MNKVNLFYAFAPINFNVSKKCFSVFFQRVYGILASPESEWRTIASEPIYDPQDLIRDYAMPMIVTATLIEVIVSGILTGIKTKLVWTALVHFALLSLLLAITTSLIQSFAPRFQASDDRNQAAKVAVYGSTPIWIATILSSLLPFGALFFFFICSQTRWFDLCTLSLQLRSCACSECAISTALWVFKRHCNYAISNVLVSFGCLAQVQSAFSTDNFQC